MSLHVWEQLFVVEKFVDGHLVETETYERSGRYFTIDEAVQYAEAAGFEDIRVTQRLSGDPPEKDSGALAVRCSRPVR